MCCLDDGLGAGFLKTSWLVCLFKVEAVGLCDVDRATGFLNTSLLTLERNAGAGEPRTLLRLDDEVLPRGSLDG